MIGGAPGGLFARRRYGRPIVTGTSVQSRNTAASGRDARVQFIAYDAPYLERLHRGDAGTASPISVE